MTLFNPWVILGILASLLFAGGAGYWKGHKDADRSAEISRMTAEIGALKWAAEQATMISKDIEAAAKRDADRRAEAEKAGEDLIGEAISSAVEKQGQIDATNAALQACLSQPPVPPDPAVVVRVVPPRGSPPVAQPANCPSLYNSSDRLGRLRREFPPGPIRHNQH